MSDSARNTIPQGNNSAARLCSFELSDALLKIGNPIKKEKDNDKFTYQRLYWHHQ